MGHKSGLTYLPFDHLDDFLIKYVISDGPYTITLKAYQKTLQRPVFIKILKPRIDNHSEWIRRFQQEARICALLKHPNITQVYHMGIQDNFHYIAMEYVDGFTLKGTGKLPLDIALYFAKQILECLQYVHQNAVIHRDLKPGNILIDTITGIKLTDFGLAYLLENTSLTAQGTLVGTPAYMAPEQITGEPLSEKTDLFSFGAVLYEMISGNQAFTGENYSACLNNVLHTNPPNIAEIPRPVSDFINDLLDKTPENRPESAAVCINRLSKIQQDLNTLPGKEKVTAWIKSIPSGKDELSKPLFRKKSGYLKSLVLTGTGLSLIVIIVYLLPKIIPPQSHSDLTAAGPDTIAGLASDSLPVNKRESAVFSDTAENIKAAPAMIKKEIKPDENPVLAAKDMPVAQAELTIDVQPWANIYINHQLLDSQIVRKQMKLPAAEYSLLFTHPNFKPRVQHINLKAGEHKSISWSFLSTAGYLWIEVEPWAKIYIDGKYIDTTPLSKPVPVESGEHVLELVHPNYPEHREIVKILKGDTIAIRKNLITN